ncbi:Gti1/Pac2 family protein [Sporobolomyces salmoneus]|uniref:Gti1/Pac2 family protein n=1 Tax=Sporobolomyces salmoneus TaxID=183962 RepID=UPI00316B7370
MTGGELPTSGHSYFGVVNSGEQAHAIIEASKLGLLPRVTRRLTDEERIRFVRAGAVFVWEEEEAGIRRWTDHIKWSPSRVSGAFLTYTEMPSKGPETLIKQSFSSVDPSGTKMHLIAYTNKMALSDGSLPSAAHDPLIQGMLARRSNAGRDPRQQPGPLLSPPISNSPISSSASSSYGSNPGKRRQYRGSHPALPPIYPVLSPPAASSSDSLTLPTPPPTTLPPMLLDPRQRPQSTSHDGDSRPRSASSAYEERPRTSSSEPRPNSSYDSLPRPSFPNPSFPYSLPAYNSASTCPSSSSTSSRALPSFFPTYGSQPIDSFPHYSNGQQPFDNSRYPLPPPISAPHHHHPFEGSLPPPRMAPANVSPLDSQSRELPPFPNLPPMLPNPRNHSPPHSYPNPHEESLQRQVDDGRGQSWRGMEDERQLSLLGRRL